MYTRTHVRTYVRMYHVCTCVRVYVYTFMCVYTYVRRIIQRRHGDMGSKGDMDVLSFKGDIHVCYIFARYFKRTHACTKNTNTYVHTL